MVFFSKCGSFIEMYKYWALSPSIDKCYLAGWAREKWKIHPQGKFWLFTQEQIPVKMPRWLGNAHPNWCCRPPNKMVNNGFFIGHCCVDPERQMQQCTTVGDTWTWTLARGFLKVGTKSQTRRRAPVVVCGKIPANSLHHGILENPPATCPPLVTKPIKIMGQTLTDNR